MTTLLNAQRDVGMNEVIWQGRDSKGNQVASGAYFYRLQTGGFTATKRMVVLK